MNNENFYQGFISVILALSILWFIWFYIEQKDYILYYK